MPNFRLANRPVYRPEGSWTTAPGESSGDLDSFVEFTFNLDPSQVARVESLVLEGWRQVPRDIPIVVLQPVELDPEPLANPFRLDAGLLTLETHLLDACNPGQGLIRTSGKAKRWFRTWLLKLVAALGESGKEEVLAALSRLRKSRRTDRPRRDRKPSGVAGPTGLQRLAHSIEPGAPNAGACPRPGGA